MPPPVRRRPRRAQIPGAMGRALAAMLPSQMMPWVPSPNERFRVPPGDFPVLPYERFRVPPGDFPPSPNRDWRTITGPAAHTGWTDFGRGFGSGVRQFINPTTSDFLTGNLNPFNRYLNQSTFSGAIEGGPQFSFPFPWLDRPQIASDIGNVPNYLNPTTNAFLNTPQLMMTDPEVRAAMAPSITPATTMAAQPNIWDAPPASNYVRDPLQWLQAGQPYAPPATPFVVPQPSPTDIGIPLTSTAELMQRSRNTGIQGNIPPEIRAAMGPSAFSGRGGLPTGTIMESGGGPRVTDRYNRRIQKERESRGQYLAGQNRGRGGL